MPAPLFSESPLDTPASQSAGTEKADEQPAPHSRPPLDIQDGRNHLRVAVRCHRRPNLPLAPSNRPACSANPAGSSARQPRTCRRPGLNCFLVVQPMMTSHKRYDAA